MINAKQHINELFNQFSTKTGCVVEEISSNHQVDDSFYIDEKISSNKNRKTLVNFWR